MSSTYRINLDMFSGPLDLLLYLVRRNEVEIVEVSLSRITTQFEEYLEVLKFIDLDLVGDFIVLASTLIELKSREVLPRPAEESEAEQPDADKPMNELIQQLLEYKKFKDAATALEDRSAEWQDRFPRLTNDRPRQGKDPAADTIKEVELWDLVSALSRILRTKIVTKESRIRYDETPISVYIERIGERVRAERRVAFSSCFEGSNDRGRIVGTFLAILELLRHHQYRAEQPVDFEEIWVLPPLDPNAPLPQQRNSANDTEA